MNNLDKMYSADSTISGYARSYLMYLKDVIDRISTQQVDDFVKALLSARERGARIYFIGNGGSSATASHFANDLSVGVRTDKRPFRAISLCDNQSVMTAVANDFGYEHVFSMQLGSQLSANDVVVALSASGNSENLVKAIDYAKKNNAVTVAITSFDGGKLQSIADISVHVPTEKGEYGPAEDTHMILDHLVSSYLIRLVRNEK